MTLTPEQFSKAKMLFNSYVEGCVPYVNEAKFPGRIFWMKNGHLYFEYNKNFPKHFWIKQLIWSNFEIRLNINPQQVRELLKPLAEEAFKLGQITPSDSSPFNSEIAEAAFKLGELIAVDSVLHNENKSWIISKQWLRVYS